MERGLLWLPLLTGFFGLAALGWWEYRKVETYRTWAENFERSKYDLYTVLGWTDTWLTWGKPSPFGPRDLKTLNLKDVQAVWLLLDEQRLQQDQNPLQSKPPRQIELEFQPQGIRIPFSQLDLALVWWQALCHALEQD
ncbi:hypothetical protein L1047_14470 [Synechococcus sp. Nb3U1]|uniref:hypothetical protein n=1 Tax=Synechococcus sp. Nb3U1 TaxID=1914529 RepID=UPI001F288535|nr:hypothetical protein [Synechococcus sp. Nb3U1]MCF2972397.1 hypothetical protein [Synechococcus sp. Nb3U1]